ncbi:hypothetical protein ACWEKT_35920 [Nocardia takedensis]
MQVSGSQSFDSATEVQLLLSRRLPSPFVFDGRTRADIAGQVTIGVPMVLMQYFSITSDDIDVLGFSTGLGRFGVTPEPIDTCLVRPGGHPTTETLCLHR